MVTKHFFDNLVLIVRWQCHFFDFSFSMRSSISRNALIFESCTSFMIISRAISDPSRNFDVNSSAYWIQTQFAHPDIQQLVGGDGIYSNKRFIKNKQYFIEILKKTVFIYLSICRRWVCFRFIVVCPIRWMIVRKSNTLHANWSVVNCIL